jgi:hypothetical protein
MRKTRYDYNLTINDNCPIKNGKIQQIGEKIMST